MTQARRPGRIALAILCAASGGAWATEYGTVISSTPVVAAMPAPQRQCTEEQRVYPPRSTGAGALIGAIAGAAIGNSLGAGAGQAAATGLGMVAGSVIGDSVETAGTPAPTTLVQNCRTVTRLEPRTVGYDVVYEHQGVRRTTRLARSPGERVALDQAPDTAPAGTVYGQSRPAPAALPPGNTAVTVIEYGESRLPPRVVYVQPEYYAPPAYAYGWPYTTVGMGLWVAPGWYGGYGGWRGHHHYRH